MAPQTPPVDDSALRAYWQHRHAREVCYGGTHDLDDCEPRYRAARHHVERALPGDFDRDGR